MKGAAAPGWYPEPTGRPGVERFYDGADWTDQVRSVQLAFPDPDAAPSPVGTAQFRPVAVKATAAGFQTPGEAPFVPSTGPQTVLGDALFRPPGEQESGDHWQPSVRPGTAQAMQLSKAIGFKLPERPTHADPGWFPDPARTPKIRFYDGEGWTARVRAPMGARHKKLPAAAVAFRARMLAVSDERAARSETGRTWRTPTTVVPAARPAPSLHVAVRTRAGRVGGMMSMAAVVTATTLALFLGWQHWLAPQFAEHAQAQMRAELAQDLGGDLVDYGDDPTPVDVTAAVTGDGYGNLPLDSERPGAGAPATPTPGAGDPGSSQSGPSQPSPDPGEQTPGTSRPRDISPWPPTSWAPPKNRRARSVKEFRVGTAVGRVVIPRMGMDEVLLAGTGSAELGKGVGIGTWGVLPGTPGNAVLAGHRTGYGGAFENIDDLRYGDQIIVEIPLQGRAVFEVRGHKIVRPHETGVSASTDGVRLTLTSCHPPGSVGYRYVVQAEMVAGDWLDYSTNRGAWEFKS